MAKQFIDKHSLIGRATKAPESELRLKANSSSRSLNQLEKEKRTPPVLACEITRDGYLILGTAEVIGDKIRITQMNALVFAKWIVDTYDKRRLNVSRKRASKTNLMAGKSEESK